MENRNGYKKGMTLNVMISNFMTSLYNIITFKWLRNKIKEALKETHYYQDIFCMNCYEDNEAKLKKGTKIVGTDAICQKCGCKDKIRYCMANGGYEKHYIN